MRRCLDGAHAYKGGDDGGTGLGLDNVFQATRELDGGIRVDSSLEAGSTFSVYLPLSGSK
jgi:signal transduction histidine kinase